MDRDRAGRTLHQLVLEAIARGAAAQEQSRAVHERHQAIHDSLSRTLEEVRRRRSRAAGASRPDGV